MNGMTEPVPEPDAKEIRAGIRRAAEAIRRADVARERALDELLDWAEAAQRCRQVTMDEVADAAELTRGRVYQMLRERRPAA